ncbi:photosystem II reaction center W protein, chloroplastic [Diospyros lotus]|uniref:photosystem II reaction center W protein, chloroplastic n=1 Tax=Diospyros lotus TaxID=55363 RepID=UPI00224DF1ED|nr:photosystem II reaction center W protein, chloroplastic [Diospyros lotus]
MASLTAFTPTSSVTRAALVQKRAVAAPSSVLGLPAMAKKGKVRCSMEGESRSSKLGMEAAAASWMAAVSAATISSPAMALVDERMSTEGTGLPFGLSNNLLVWILAGVFGLIWAFYIVYTSSLEEDEESGLSL